MIDLEEIVALQTLGMDKINKLPEGELDPLVGYFALVGNDLLKFAAKNKLPTGEALVNAIRIGMALGLETQIVDGKLIRR